MVRPFTKRDSYLLACLVVATFGWAFPARGEDRRPELVVQSGHADHVGAVAFSPDGQYALTGSDDSSAILWDVATGRQVRSFKGHTGRVHSLAISPDGALALTGASDRTAILWDVATGQPLHKLEGLPGFDVTVSFNPRVRQALVSSASVGLSGGVVILWDVTTGNRIRTMSAIEKGGSAAFSPDGTQVVTWAVDGRLTIWDEAGQAVRSIQEDDNDAEGGSFVAFSPQGDRIVTRGFKKVTVRHAATGRVVNRFQGTPQALCSAAFSPDGKSLVTGSFDATAIVWDVDTGRAVRTLRGHSGNGWNVAVAFSPDGRQILTGAGDRTIMLWDAATGERVRTFAGVATPMRLLAIEHSGRRLLIRAGDGPAYFWDTTTGEQLRAFPDAKTFVAGAAFSPDDRRLLTNTGSSPAFLWDLAIGAKVTTFEKPSDGVTAVALSRDGRRVLTLGYRKRQNAGTGFAGLGASYPMDATIWDAQTGRPLATLAEGPTDQNILMPPNVAAFSPDGTRVVTASHGASVLLWDAATGRKLFTFDGQAGMAYAAAFSPDGTILATGHINNVAILWDVRTGARLAALEGHTTQVAALAFSPDGRLLATASPDNTAVLWDVAARKKLQSLTGHSAALTSVLFSPDSTRVYTGSQDGTVRAWSVTSGRELARLSALDGGQEWLTITPEGYFNGSPGGQELVSWRVEGKIFPVALYRERFFRPELVTRALSGQAIEQPAVPGDRTPPRVELELVRQEDDRRVTVRGRAFAGGSTATIASLRVLVQGRETSAPLNAQTREEGGRVLAFEATVEFPPQQPRAIVSAVAVDDLGLRSAPAVVVATRKVIPREHTTLYVLSVGIDRYRHLREGQQLRFARADAESLAAELAKQRGRAFDDVQVRSLADDQADVAGVRAGLKWLQESCTESDVALVYFSGHGVELKEGESGLYYATHDFNPADPERTSLPWEELAFALGKERLKAWQVLFFADCCHAGAFGVNSASQNDMINALLLRRPGIFVFAASRDFEVSLERPDWNHGAFTLALLEGIGGKADANHDGKVTMTELQTYTYNRVQELTGDKQHPAMPTSLGFDIGYVVALLGPG